MRDAADAKKELRARARALLAARPTDRIARGSRAVCDRIAVWEPFRVAARVMAFVPVPGEVDLRSLLEVAIRAGTVVCLPRANWAERRLEPVPVSALSGLVASRHGILEPPGGLPAARLAELDVVLVPGLAFDPAGHRLGRGAGFYDRFLADPALRAVTCGVCFDDQVVPAVPTEAWDVPVKAVATDGRLIVIS